MRLNTKNYKDADPTGTEYVVVNLQQDGRPLWYHHDNDDIDVAVIPLTDYTIAPLADKHWFRIFDDDAGAISLSWFATPKVFNTASIGSSVVTAGLVPELSRAKRNYLTYRFGRISNIFPESIDVPCRLPLHFSHKDRIWAVAANYAPGNSGSPVLLLPIDVIQGNGMVLGQTELRGLIGLVSLGSPGTDFSGITPVSYIFEVIQQIFKENKWPTDALPSYQYAQR